MYNTLKNKIAQLFLLTVLAMVVSLNTSAQGLDGLEIDVQAGSVDVIKVQDLIKLAPGQNSSGTRTLFSVTFKNNTSSAIEVPSEAMSFEGKFNGTGLGFSLVNRNKITFPPNKSVTLTSSTIANSKFIDFKLSGTLPDVEELAKKLGKDLNSLSLASPVPSGVYTFGITVKGGNSDSDDLIISNVEANVVILGPGDEFGSGDIPEIDDRQPLISWTGGSPSFDVIVVEKTSSETSLGDLLTKTPNFRTQTNASSVQYPASGVKPLQPGKTYVVAVASIVKDFSSTADSRKWATPFVFKIREQQTGSESASNQLVDALRRISGSQYDAAFDQLANAKPTGKLFLDDQPIGISDLKEIMGKIQSQTYSLKGIAIK